MQRTEQLMNLPNLKKIGPKPDSSLSIGTDCLACGTPFKAGDYTTLIGLGPGNDLEEQQKARAGQIYNAVAVEVHWTCATGLDDWTPDG